MNESTPSPAESASERAPGHLLAIVILFALPLFLRLWPIEHGLPENYLADTHVVKNALGMARDKNPVPPSGQYSTYPYLLPYLLLPVYAGEYAFGRATGEWSGSGEFKQRVLEEPALVHLPARILLALLCALTPLVVFRGARAAGLRRGAWVAAWLVSTGLLHLHFSVQERPWGPLVFFMALTALYVIRYAKSHRTRDLVYGGLAAGLAAATHQAGIPALGMCGLGWLFAALEKRELLTRKRLIAAASCVALAFVVALLLGYPFYLIHGSPETTSFEGAAEVSGSIGGQAILFELRWASVERLSRALFGYDPAIVILSILGLFAALARRETRAVTVFVIVWLAFFMTNQNDHIRYLLPAAVLLVYPAGVAAELLLQKRFGLLVLAPVCLFSLVQATRLAWVLRQPDSREVALSLIQQQLPDNARLAIDRYGPNVPMDEASLRRVAGWRELGSREKHRLAFLEVDVTPPSGPGRDVLRLEDLYQFSDRDRNYELNPAVIASLSETVGEASAALAATSTDECFRLLGITHVLLVDRRPLDGIPPAVLDTEPGLDDEPKPLPLTFREAEWPAINPTGDSSFAAETLLPTDMDFPLTAIWQVERPGPYMELRALDN